MHPYKKMFSSSAVYVYVYHMNVWCLGNSEKGMLGSLEPEFKTVVNYYVGVSAQVLKYS